MNEIKKLKEKQEKLKKEIEKLEMQIKELKEQKKKCKRWRAKENELYWFISPNGVAYHTMELNDSSDRRSYEIGNYFRTEEEAEKMVEKIKIYTRLKDLALRLNKGETICWNDLKQSKYSITRDVETNELVGTSIYCYQDIGQIYCLDSNFLNIAKREIGEKNLRKLFK